jgi:hypothetical protein
LFAHEDEAHRAAAETEHVVIRYREFDGFISRIGLKPSYDALKTYATHVYRKMEAAGLHGARAFCSAWKLLRPSPSSTQTSPSSQAVLTFSLATALATGCSLVVQSLPLHQNSLAWLVLDAGENAVTVVLDFV